MEFLITNFVVKRYFSRFDFGLICFLKIYFKELIFELFGDFKDKANQEKSQNEQLRKRKLQENLGIHWTNPEKVSKGQCVYCGHGSSTKYECFQCKVKLHPCCMVTYHEWDI